MRFSFLSSSKESPGIRFLRFVLLIAVFVGVGWLYTKHFDQAMVDIQARSSVNDKSAMLTAAQKKDLRELAGLFDEEFGLELRVRIDKGPVLIPELTPRTVFFGLDVTDQTLLVELPAVWEKALGSELIETLEREHMVPYFVADSWPTGLLKAVAIVWENMANLESKGEN